MSATSRQRLAGIEQCAEAEGPEADSAATLRTFQCGCTGEMRYPDPLQIIAARDKIDPVFLGTPTRRLPSLSAGLGASLTFKDERMNPIHSFKGRGAEVVVQSYPVATDFVTASAGNFGQGMAWAVRRRQGRLTIFAAETAAKCKLDAMASLGANVVLCGVDFDAAKAAAREHSVSVGSIFIEDGAHAEIAEGAGTIALELTDDCSPIDAIVVPLGNGSLVAGIGCWMKYRSPATRVIAVAAKGAPAMGLAVMGRPFDSTRTPSTIADGIAVRVPVPEAVEAVRRVVDEVMFVDDEHISEALRLIENGTCIRAEAAGVVGLAGVLAQPSGYRGRHVAIPICGGNRDNAPAQADTCRCGDSEKDGR